MVEVVPQRGKEKKGEVDALNKGEEVLEKQEHTYVSTEDEREKFVQPSGTQNRGCLNGIV